ncbi:hypothetical protein B0H21DRAFT_49943 [Amylocystis lapponica]|nr:hypothetical protein B0H21DRAFT_49943 [Amylocystis lapponica]
MVVVSPENAINVAKEVIQSSLSCEWGDRCKVCLNSWQALQEHLCLVHLQRARERCSYECYFSKCAARNQGTIEDLEQHVELSHLSRVVIPCPIEGCSELFGRHAQLPGHIKEEHINLQSSTSTSCVRSNNLRAKPLRRPSPRTRASETILQPLPSQARTYTILSLPVSRARKRPAPAPTPSQVARKWSKLSVQDPDDDADDAEDAQPFPDLRILSGLSLDTQFSDFTIRRKPPEPAEQLSRPQPLWSPRSPASPRQSAWATARSKPSSVCWRVRGLSPGRECGPTAATASAAHPQTIDALKTSESSHRPC